MKNTINYFGIIALVAVVGFSMAACGDGGGGGKSAGAEVSAPTLASTTETSITINAVVTPSNGQTVEYVINSTNTAPASGWQDGLTFSGLTANTTYYIFARSKENATYNAGAASASLSVTTDLGTSGGDEPIEVEVEGDDLAAKLAWVKTNARSNATYLITINKDEELTETTATDNKSNNLSYSGKTNITVQLTGTEEERIINFSESINYYFSGSLFTIGNGVTLVFNDNITLQGESYKDGPLVQVNPGGALEMNEGSKITGNDGGGVNVNTNGTFTMNGGEISGNTSTRGGGVYVNYDGTFRIVTGMVYGIDETDTTLRNYVRSSFGHALYSTDGTSAQYGTFNGDKWNGINLPLPGTNGSSTAYTNNTIKVVNGELILP